LTRPAIADERLARNKDGQVVLTLKTPYRDGTIHIILSLLEFMQRLSHWFPGLSTYQLGTFAKTGVRY